MLYWQIFWSLNYRVCSPYFSVFTDGMVRSKRTKKKTAVLVSGVVIRVRVADWRSSN